MSRAVSEIVVSSVEHTLQFCTSPFRSCCLALNTFSVSAQFGLVNCRALTLIHCVLRVEAFAEQLHLLRSIRCISPRAPRLISPVASDLLFLAHLLSHPSLYLFLVSFPSISCSLVSLLISPVACLSRPFLMNSRPARV